MIVAAAQRPISVWGQYPVADGGGVGLPPRGVADRGTVMAQVHIQAGPYRVVSLLSRAQPAAKCLGCGCVRRYLRDRWLAYVPGLRGSVTGLSTLSRRPWADLVMEP